MITYELYKDGIHQYTNTPHPINIHITSLSPGTQGSDFQYIAIYLPDSWWLWPWSSNFEKNWIVLALISFISCKHSWIEHTESPHHLLRTCYFSSSQITSISTIHTSHCIKTPQLCPKSHSLQATDTTGYLLERDKAWWRNTVNSHRQTVNKQFNRRTQMFISAGFGALIWMSEWAKIRQAKNKGQWKSKEHKTTNSGISHLCQSK